MASEACNKGQVRIDDKSVKPSREVYPLQEIIVRKIETINALQVQRPQIVHLFTSVVTSTPKEINIPLT